MLAQQPPPCFGRVFRNARLDGRGLRGRTSRHVSGNAPGRMRGLTESAKARTGPWLGRVAGIASQPGEQSNLGRDTSQTGQAGGAWTYYATRLAHVHRAPTPPAGRGTN